MKSDGNTQSVTDWLSLQLPRLIGVVLIIFVAFVVSDIIGELMFPVAASGPDSLDSVFAEMKSFGYWGRKLVFSVLGGALYGALLWYLRARTLRES